MKRLVKIIFLLALSVAFSRAARAQFPCTTSSNVGFQIPNIGNTTNWGDCINTDLTMLDTLLGGSNTLTVGSTTPSVSGFYRLWIAANTVPVTINNFTGGFPGEHIDVVCSATDTFTSIIGSASIVVDGGWGCASSTSISFALVNGIWKELGRAGGGAGGSGVSVQQNGTGLGSVSTINFTTNMNATVVGDVANVTSTASNIFSGTPALQVNSGPINIVQTGPCSFGSPSGIVWQICSNNTDLQFEHPGSGGSGRVHFDSDTLVGPPGSATALQNFNSFAWDNEGSYFDGTLSQNNLWEVAVSTTPATGGVINSRENLWPLFTGTCSGCTADFALGSSGTNPSQGNLSGPPMWDWVVLPRDGFTAIFQHTFTATRTFTYPDATGTFLLSTASLTSGQALIAGGSSTVGSSKALVGTDAGLATAGTISNIAGTSVCSTANGGITTTGCGGGFTAGTDLSGTATSQNVIGFHFGATGIPLSTTTPPLPGQCLEYNGANITGAACSGSGATPGGTDTAVQVNHPTGTFFGDPTNFFYNTGTHNLTITGAMVTAVNSFALSQLVNPTNAGDVICGTSSWADCVPGIAGRTVTTSPDPLTNTDRLQMVTYSSTSPVAVSIASPASLGNNYGTYVRNINSGLVTITPASGLINGASNASVSEGQHCTLSSQDNVNYTLDCSNGAITVAAAHLLFTPNPNGGQLSLTNLQGTDSNLLTSGTISGTGSPLCTDALGGATTTGCSSGGGAGALNQSVSFTSQTSATLTVANATSNITWNCWDNSSPANAIFPSNVTVNTSTFLVTFNFSVAQSGRCVVNSSGSGVFQASESSSTSWSVTAATHGMGTNVLVETYDSSGNRIFGNVAVDASGNVTVNWALAQSGKIVIAP